jgi:flagellar biosynthesis GTPase FlhF
MIIEFGNINTYKSREVSGELIISQEIKLHKPTGVFFTSNINEANGDFLYFKVAAINSKGEVVEPKTFDGITAKSFFEAVDYFEKLINDRIPQEDNKPPSIGKFFFIKEMDSIVKLTMLSDQSIIIDRKDIDKVFSPPKKKPYGRLNMFAVNKEKYEPIKGKFALKYNDDETKLFLDQMSFEQGKAFVYDMTPYSTDEQDQQSDPSEVNDDRLTLDQIEDEDPKDMKGDQKQDQKSEGESESESEGKDEGQDESKQEEQVQDKEDKSDQQKQSAKQEQQQSEEELSDQEESFQEQDEINEQEQQKSIQESENDNKQISSGELGEKSEKEINAATDIRSRLSQFMGVQDIVIEGNKGC